MYDPDDDKGGHKIWKFIQSIQSDSSTEQTTDMTLTKAFTAEGQRIGEGASDFNHRLKGLYRQAQSAGALLFAADATPEVKKACNQLVLAMAKEKAQADLQVQLAAIRGRTVDKYDNLLAAHQQERAEHAAVTALAASSLFLVGNLGRSEKDSRVR